MLRKILLAVLAGCAFSSHAIIWHYGNFNSKKKTCAVTSWSGSQPSSGKLTVPETYTHTDGVTYKVNTIASNALDNLTEVTEIVIHAGVVNIGDAIQEEYINLNGDSENFFNCPQLKKFTVNTDNPMFKSSSGGALYYKKANALLRVPQKMAVSNGIFKLPDDAAHIAPNAFTENTTTKKLRIPGDCTVGYNGGLNRAVNLAEYELIGGSSMVKLVNGALVSDTQDRLLSVPPASTITTLTLPSSVKEIDREACYNCINLKEIKMPGVTDISPRAFMGSGVETLDFPASIATFDTQSLAGAKSLKTINFKAKDIRLMVDFARDCSALETVTTLYPIREIEDCAFKNCRELKNFPFYGTTELEGDSIFFNCGFEKVVFPASGTSEDWGGSDLFGNNRLLTEIDASAIETAYLDSFIVPAPYAKNCMKLKTLRLPEFTSFTRYWSGDVAPVTPSFENTALTHIETGCFWIAENDYKFCYSPMDGQLDIRPRVYVAATRCLVPGVPESNRWPLKYMFMGNNGATVTPYFYCDSYTPSENYVAPRGEYFVPGGCLGQYNEAAAAGLTVTEMFGLSITKEVARMKIRTTPGEGVTEMKVSVNGGSPMTLPGYISYYPDIAYDNIDNLLFTYKMNGVPMSTRYESSHWLNTGVADILDTATTAYTVYDLEGRLILVSDDDEALDTLAPGIYIVHRGQTVTKIVRN